jgi:hypothetical protein
MNNQLVFSDDNIKSFIESFSHSAFKEMVKQVMVNAKSGKRNDDGTPIYVTKEIEVTTYVAEIPRELIFALACAINAIEFDLGAGREYFWGLSETPENSQDEYRRMRVHAAKSGILERDERLGNPSTSISEDFPCVINLDHERILIHDKDSKSSYMLISPVIFNNLTPLNKDGGDYYIKEVRNLIKTFFELKS